MAVNKKRIRLLKEGPEQSGSVVYWMSRDQRVQDNWALLYAQELALEKNVSLAVVFCLVPEFLGATRRQYGFMLKGLLELEKKLQQKNISFYLLQGAPEREIAAFVKKHGTSVLVTDFDPLKIKRRWKEKVADSIGISFYEVDAHNIVPCWIASVKQEYGAYTLRPKIKKLLPEFLEEFPNLKKHPYGIGQITSKVKWNNLFKLHDNSVAEVGWIQPGEKAGKNAISSFIKLKLARYDVNRNDPDLDGQSQLSPYLHFGQLSAQRVALVVKKSRINRKAQEAFLEELIVRRELSDNFCFYNERYDSIEGLPKWSQDTLAKHIKDKREYVYSLNQFDKAQTHDELWNAAQMEMVKTGKMHGYMRMYWAKKILEWTEATEDALKIAIYLNDRYELDGRDPNGYAGIAWSIGGVHDRPWFERPVFGKVRYMSYNGCKSKFDVKGYISKVFDFIL